MATPAAHVEDGPLALQAAAPRGSRRVILAVTSGLCLSAALPWLDCEPLAWIGLVPLLIAVRGLEPRWAFAIGWISGLTFYVTTCYWIVHTIGHYTALPVPVAAVVLLIMSSVLGCYTAAFAAGVRWFEIRGLPAVWIAPALWVTLEWARGWFFIGFPWGALGYTQYRHHALLQMVEVTGVYGISAVLVLFNTTVESVLRRRGVGVQRALPALVTLTVLMVGLPAIGRWRAEAIRTHRPAGHLRIGIAQGNVEQDHKWDPAYQGETLARYRDLTSAAAHAEGGPPTVMLWPETATPFFFQDPGALREAVLETAVDNRVFLLFGSPAYFQSGGGRLEQLNRAYLVSPEGRELGTYDKMQLVPFGEYVPYAKLLFFVDKIVVAAGALSPGRTASVLEVPGGRLGPLICYEGIFPALTRRFVAGGADVLVNVTNDAWYGRSSAPYQHLAQAAVRAVENRVPLVRAANTGISAVVDPDGRIRWQSALFEPAWHVADVTWPGITTFYTRFGDVFAWTCGLVTLAAIVVGLRRRA